MTGFVDADLLNFPFTVPGQPFTPLSNVDLERMAGPVVPVRLPTGRRAWLVTRHADVRRLLRHPALSSDADHPGYPLLRDAERTRDLRGMFIRMDGAEHARLRRMLTAEFMIKNIRRIEPLIRQTVRETLDAMVAAGPPADLVASFAMPVPSVAICHLLGVPYTDHEFFQDRSRILLDQFATGELVHAAAIELREYLGRLIAARQAADEVTPDLIGRLVAERVKTGELEPDELVGMALLLLIAGHETTANMIGLSTLLLLQQPDRFAGLAAAPETAGDLVEELLRYLTIVRTGLQRVALDDIEIGGQLIRAGEGVIAMLSLANRDDAVFADPDGFAPAQGAHQHIAFGFGVHQCIGQPLARTELQIALVELANRLPGLRALAAPGELATRDGSVIFGLAELPVTW